ncbi:MAG TPA: Xaa-Pro peptidase family protein [Patescibacteria group bacterium]|nr:Xaa-Pro peptidase family protein [Patescibacteria group bacterium]
MNTQEIQQILKKYNIDAWFLYDFRHSNHIAWKTLGLSPESHCTRRWAVVIPAEGEPVKIVNGIELHSLKDVQAREVSYSSRIEWQNVITDVLKPFKTIALEYSPNGDLPTISKVDAGTVEFLRTLGKELVSSADIAQHFDAVWTPQQLKENLKTAKALRKSMMDAFTFIREMHKMERSFTEYDVQMHIQEVFKMNGIVSSYPPTVAVGKNAANAHYSPTKEVNAAIVAGDVVLIDMWAKTEEKDSVYADITWMGYVGSEVPPRVAELFNIIADARDAAVALVKDRFAKGEKLYGYEVDDAARHVIEKAGYGKYFIHRTGHNIAEEIHGPGANMDNFETHDTRRIIPMTSFSIEPGIYIPDEIGLRTEIDVIIDENGGVLIPTAPIQDKVIALLGDNDFITVEKKDEQINTSQKE